MKAIDIANFFIDYNSHCVDETITNLKLNKLLYFAQGYSLALYDKPLFSENLKHGSMVLLWQMYIINLKAIIKKILLILMVAFLLICLTAIQ